MPEDLAAAGPPPPPPPPPPGGGSSSGGSSGGGKGGGGHKGGGKAPASPTKRADSDYLRMLASTYESLWGVPPPPGYLDGIAASHMNVFEFEAHERAKPAFASSPRYAEEYQQAGMGLAQRLGALGG